MGTSPKPYCGRDQRSKDWPRQNTGFSQGKGTGRVNPATQGGPSLFNLFLYQWLDSLFVLCLFICLLPHSLKNTGHASYEAWGPGFCFLLPIFHEIRKNRHCRVLEAGQQWSLRSALFYFPELCISTMSGFSVYFIEEDKQRKNKETRIKSIPVGPQHLCLPAYVACVFQTV